MMALVFSNKLSSENEILFWDWNITEADIQNVSVVISSFFPFLVENVSIKHFSASQKPVAMPWDTCGQFGGSQDLGWEWLHPLGQVVGVLDLGVTCVKIANKSLECIDCNLNCFHSTDQILLVSIYLDCDDVLGHLMCDLRVKAIVVKCLLFSSIFDFEGLVHQSLCKSMGIRKSWLHQSLSLFNCEKWSDGC